MLLASDTGHFSLIKALHMADLITELNGTIITLPHFLDHYCMPMCKTFIYIHTSRLLRCHVHLFIHAILSRGAKRLRQSLGGISVYALRVILRFHGREGGQVEKKEQFDGARTRFPC
jgi:hypothetical protein